MVFFTNLSAPENVHHKQEKTEAYVNENCLQSGTVYIAESQVIWINESGYGFSLDYPTIAMHGVSKDLTAFPRECLYLSLDASMPGEEGEENTEVRFAPEDSSCLNLMFQALSACQRLHPDEEQQNSDEDYDDEDFCNEADGVYRMPESEQAVISGGQNGGGMVIFEGGDPIPITPRGVNILAEEDRLDILDAAVGRNDDEDAGVAMESENTEDDAQFEDAD